MSNYPFGIDISSWQYSEDGKRKPDFDKLNAAVSFCAIRAGISWGYVDRWFRYSWDNVSVPKIAYHVQYPGEDANRQMDHLLRIIPVGEHTRYCLDLELAHGQTKARITQCTLTMLERLRRETGRYPILYSRASWVNQYLSVSDLPEVYWWLANYLRARPAPYFTPEKEPPPILPKGVGRWLIHQTGEKGDGSAVGVVSHYVDTNRWNGSEAELRAYFGLGEEEPEPEEPPAGEKLFDAKVCSWATPYVNFRSEPRVAKDTDIGDILPNTVVPVLEVVGHWYKVEHEGKVGYAMAEFFERLDSNPPAVMITIKPLSQRDGRWKAEKLGFSTLTIGSHGCLVTCFAMALGVTPPEFNRRMKAVNGFTGANVYWKMVEVAYPNAVYEKAIDCYYVPAPLDLINSLLSRGVPVMAQVDFDRSTPQLDQHWVLIIGRNGGDYWINDPWTGQTVSFLAAYGDPARWIFRIRAYRRLR